MRHARLLVEGQPSQAAPEKIGLFARLAALFRSRHACQSCNARPGNTQDCDECEEFRVQMQTW